MPTAQITTRNDRGPGHGQGMSDQETIILKERRASRKPTITYAAFKNDVLKGVFSDFDSAWKEAENDVYEEWNVSILEDGIEMMTGCDFTDVDGSELPTEIVNVKDVDSLKRMDKLLEDCWRLHGEVKAVLEKHFPNVTRRENE